MIRDAIQLALALQVFCLLALGACNKSQPQTAGRTSRPAAATQVPGQPSAASAEPRFVVSVKPLEFILGELCSGRAQVSTLLKAGANSHTYDPTPADAQKVQQSTGFFWIGPEFDSWAADFNCPCSIEIVPLLPAGMALDLAEHGDWYGAGESGSHGHTHAEHGEHAEAARIIDPHFACDPLLVRALLPALVSKLSELDPGGATAYAANAQSFATELSALHTEIEARMKACADQPVILLHPSFNYFIKRYGLNYAGVIEPYPGKEPSPKYLQGIVQLIREKQATAIFTETLLPAAPAEVIAEAAGVKVWALDPSCGNSGEQYADYADWLRYNAAVFSEALN